MLQRRGILLIIVLLQVCLVNADTLFVQAHKNVDLVNHTNYDRWAHFPSEGKQFRKVYMLYTLGCASTGCSDWDYDVNNFLMRNTGVRDSSIVRIDTISEAPIELDTIWNVFDVLEPFELGRFITPYGTYMNFRNPQYGVSGFDSSWEHTFIYDVTDYQILMRDSVLIRSQYNGWTSGFQANIVFVMIEGKPQRDVISLQNIYEHGGSYQSSSQFETNVLPEKTFAIPPGATQAQIKVIVTGHGANQAEGCAEFCNKYYEFEVDGKSRFKTQMWRNDCGELAVAPQGGTWIFSRGNWCPGDKVRENRHEISPFLQVDSIRLNMNIEAYVPGGSGGSSHNISSTLFFYGSHNYQLDAEIETIISPSSESEHIPYNPTCGQTILVIKNNGPEPLTYARIEFGAKGGIPVYAEWEGNLAFEERDTLYLGAPNWTGIDPDQTLFYARIFNQNHRYSDELLANDYYQTSIELVPQLQPLRLVLRTNGVPEENILRVRNERGELVYELADMNPFQLYQIDLDLPNGCYMLELTDDGADGLHYWYYGAINPPYTNGMNGFLRILKQGGGIYENFGGDFGSVLRYGFIIGEIESQPANAEFDTEFKVFPNPSEEKLWVQIPESGGTDGKLIIRNNLGQVVYVLNNIQTDMSYWKEIDISLFSNGMYHLELIIDDKSYKSKLIVAKQ